MDFTRQAPPGRTAPLLGLPRILISVAILFSTMRRNKKLRCSSGPRGNERRDYKIVLQEQTPRIQYMDTKITQRSRIVTVYCERNLRSWRATTGLNRKKDLASTLSLHLFV